MLEKNRQCKLDVTSVKREALRTEVGVPVAEVTGPFIRTRETVYKIIINIG
jgi:hypothetical protein